MTPVSLVGPARSTSVQPSPATSWPCPTAIRATGCAQVEHAARLNKVPSTNSFRQTREPRLAMEPVVIACGGCGTAIRIRHPEIARRRVCPRCRTDLTRDQDRACRQGLARLTGILIATLLLATGAMLGVLTSASHSAANHVRGESPPAGPDTAPAQLAPAGFLFRSRWRCFSLSHQNQPVSAMLRWRT